MLNDRVYRKALTFDEALKELKINSGSQFDPELIEVAISIYDKFVNFL